MSKSATPYVDKKGNRIYDCSLLKMYHFTDSKHKRNYMYKHVRILNGMFVFYHLDGSNDSLPLSMIAVKNTIPSCEVVQ